MKQFEGIRRVVVVWGMLLAAAAVPVMAGTYSGGSGTETDPYRIATAANWQELMATSADWSEKYFILTANINLAGVAVTPVGSSYDTGFTGCFDGQNYMIRNAVINQTSNSSVGLFGWVQGGLIKNLGVETVSVTGGEYSVGGLVGYLINGTVLSCYVTGSVTGRSYVGGLVGSSGDSTITASYATCNVTGSYNTAGLVGYISRGTITSCYATGSVAGETNVGGLVGSIGSGTTITSCYAKSNVNGVSYVGGLLGSYSDSYWILSRITDCFAVGAVTGTGSYVGGLMGDGRDGLIFRNFWDTETTGQSASAGGTGLTTAEMKSMATYQNAGWLTGHWVMQDGIDYPHLAWEMTVGTPIPAAVVPFPGGGIEGDPYQISTAEQFGQLSGLVPLIFDKHFRLMNDIDMAGMAVEPIDAFVGVFDGDGHVIHNVIINQPENDYVAIFSKVYSGGQIRNLGLENAAITGDYYVGGLVGRNEEGTITRCFSIGTVIGRGEVGGLVGKNRYGDITSCYAAGNVTSSGGSVGGLVGYIEQGTITLSYAACEVKGDEIVGGLVGSSSGSITSCYATGAVSGFSGVGGLAGECGGSGIIYSCYATGLVRSVNSSGGLVGVKIEEGSGLVIASFWDIETTGQMGWNGGIGLPTAAMQDAATYLDAYWDFAGETKWGMDDVWLMPAEGGYPLLSWQFAANAARPGNDDFYNAAAMAVGTYRFGSTEFASGLDLTAYGYRDSLDVWYYFEPTQAGSFSISLGGSDFDTTLAVFDENENEIVFNDDSDGITSALVLKAKAGVPYYIRIAGYELDRGAYCLYVGLPGRTVGDLDEDGAVDLGDFALFASTWLSRSGDNVYNLACDLTNAGNEDEVIDLSDLVILAEHWLEY